MAAQLYERGVGVPSSFPSAPVLKAQAHKLSTEIFALWDTLNSIATRREGTFRKRWLKKNKNVRAIILLRAWPDMATKHGPDFWVLNHPESSQNAERYENSFRYPHINLEDLTEPRPLLLLLNARARSSPSAFVHDDVNLVRVGMLHGRIPLPSLRGYMMYLAGQETSRTYGRLVSYAEDGEALQLQRSGLQFTPGIGMLALEAEHKILTFLVKCCQEVFQDFSFEHLVLMELPIQPEPPPLVSLDSPYVQLSILRAEAPYRARVPQDFQALKTLISARCDAALDHIWDIREDPAYFASVAKTLVDRSKVRVLDTLGESYPCDDDYMFWHNVLSLLATQAYITFVIWSSLLNRVTVVVDVMGVVELSPQVQLPTRLANAFLE